MSFILRIFVMGFVALVPGQEQKDLTLVLPVAPVAVKHVPLIVYPCGKLSSDCDPHDAATIHRELNLDAGLKNGRLVIEDETFGVLRLSGVYIDISDLPAGQLHFAHGRRKTGLFNRIKALPATMAEVADFSWIPEMRDITPESAVIRDELLSEPSMTTTAALLHLANVEGNVRVYGLAKDGPVIPSVAFKTKDSIFERGTVVQAVGDTLLIEIQVDAASVDLSTIDFEGNHVYNVSIAPQPGSRVVDVLIGNLTPLPAEQRGARIMPLKKDVSAHFGGHFNLYYDIATKSPARNRLPFGTGSFVKADGVDPDPPSVVRVVSRGDEVSGNSRPICTIVSFASP